MKCPCCFAEMEEIGTFFIVVEGKRVESVRHDCVRGVCGQTMFLTETKELEDIVLQLFDDEEQEQPMDGLKHNAKTNA